MNAITEQELVELEAMINDPKRSALSSMIIPMACLALIKEIRAIRDNLVPNVVKKSCRSCASYSSAFSNNSVCATCDTSFSSWKAMMPKDKPSFKCPTCQNKNGAMCMASGCDDNDSGYVPKEKPTEPVARSCFSCKLGNQIITAYCTDCTTDNARPKLVKKDWKS